MTAGLLLVGASGLAREVLAAGITGVVGILDDDVSLHGTVVGGVPVVGALADAGAREEDLLVCVGPSRSRAAVVDRLRESGVSDARFATFVARSARVGMTSDVGGGSILLDGVVVTGDAVIGRHVVVMPNCTVTHDDVVEDFATLAAGVSLGGGVRVGHAAYLGMNASVRQGAAIGRGAVVGMGAAVLRDVPEGQTWVGVPAHVVEKDVPPVEAAREGVVMSVPFLDLAAQQAEIIDEVTPVWHAQLAGAAFIGGPEVDAFEREYADYIGVPHVVGVSNGTDALELAYRAIGVGPGDEVIMPANTFIATAEAVSRIGAVPVFVDVDEEYLLIDPDAVEAAITPRTRAIVPVHLFGQTAPMGLVTALAQRHGIDVVEDAAQAQGAGGASGRAGALSRVAATSFYPGKNLGAAGDAGAVLTGDPELAARVRNLAAHGSSVKYVHDHIGMNARLDAVQAAVLRAKLRRLEGWNAARRAAADRYGELLAGLDGVRLPAVRPGNTDVWHLYVVRVQDRERVIARLAEAGIGTGIHYPTAVPFTDAYASLDYHRGQFPVAEAAADTILSLPMFPHLSADQQARVAEVLRAAVEA